MDTIDDEGTLFVVTHGPADATGGPGARAAAPAWPRSGARRLPLGIMVDGVPLSGVAAGAVTIGRLVLGHPEAHAHPPG